MRVASVNNNFYNKNQSAKNSRPSFGIKTIEMNALAEETFSKLSGTFKKDYQEKLSLIKSLKNKGEEIDSLTICGYPGSSATRITAKSGDIIGTDFLFSDSPDY